MEENLVSIIEERDADSPKFIPDAENLLLTKYANGLFYGWKKDEEGNYYYGELTTIQALQSVVLTIQLQAFAAGYKTFASRPNAPYKVGDLYEDTEAGIYTCIVGKTTAEAFSTSDWELLVPYDSTTIAEYEEDTSDWAGLDVVNNDTGISLLADTEENPIRIWAGDTYENRESAPFRVLQDGTVVMSKAEVTGKINAESGNVGGFTVANGRLGELRELKEVTDEQGNKQFVEVSNNGKLTLMDNILKYSVGNRWASIGSNKAWPLEYCPDDIIDEEGAGTAIPGPGFFLNTEQNTWGTNYGVLITVKNGYRNIALHATGNIISNGLQTGYNRVTLNPAANIVDIAGYSAQSIVVKFANSNSGVGLPSRYTVAEELGISSSTPFSVRFFIVCDRTTTVEGGVWGRNTTVNGMNDVRYPQRLNNNGVVQNGKLAMNAGDISQFQLSYDGTDYLAYQLGYRT